MVQIEVLGKWTAGCEIPELLLLRVLCKELNLARAARVYLLDVFFLEMRGRSNGLLE